MKYLLSFIVAFAMISNAFAQEKEPRLIQLSGMVVSGDSLSAVPFTSVLIKGTNRGTVCDYYGFFSLVAKANDTLQFSSLGHKDGEFIIPDTLESNRYSIIQLVDKDTFELAEQIVYPWPSKEQFKDAFLSLNAPNDQVDIAFQNMTREDIRMAVQGVPMSSRENSQYDIQREYTKLYNIGQLNTSTSLLNPLAWAQFIQAWKRGDFKSK